MIFRYWNRTSGICPKTELSDPLLFQFYFYLYRFYLLTDHLKERFLILCPSRRSLGRKLKEKSVGYFDQLKEKCRFQMVFFKKTVIPCNFCLEIMKILWAREWNVSCPLLLVGPSHCLRQDPVLRHRPQVPAWHSPASPSLSPWIQVTRAK